MPENDVHQDKEPGNWRSYLKDDEKQVVKDQDARILRRKLIKRDEINHEFNTIMRRCIKRKQRARGGK